MSGTAGTSIPAGWYTDPAGSDQLRWWDGMAWTTQLAPRPSAPVAAPVPMPTPVVQAPSYNAAPTIVQPSAPVHEEEKYVPFQNPWSAGNRGAGMGAPFQPTGWNTGGVWMLATSAIWILILVGVATGVAVSFVGATNFDVAGQIDPAAYSFIVGAEVVAWLLMVLAATRDKARLRELGYTSETSVLWILLAAPLVYLIIRTVRVKRASGRGLAPLIFYLVSYLGIIVLGIVAAIAIPLFLASRSGDLHARSTSSNASSLAAGLTTGLEKNGGNYSVTCTPFTAPTTSPVDVNCIAIDLSTKISHTLLIQVSPGTAGGQDTVELMSVTPPISAPAPTN